MSFGLHSGRVAITKPSIPEPVRRWLHDALPAWRQQGLIGPEQAEGILALYEDDELVRERRRSAVSFALFGLGAFLLGLAVLLLIGFNWEAMPREAKLAVALAVIGGAHALALRLRRTSPAVGEVVFFLGCLFYGAGIWLVGQAFHLDAHYPDGVFWWAVGVLPFALVLDSLMIHLLFVWLLATWAGMETLGFMHFRPWWAWGLLPNGAWALPVLAAPGLVWAYRRSSPTAVGLYVALFAWWMVLQAFAWRFGLSPLSVFWIGGVGALLLIVAESHRPGDPMAVPYRLWGTLLAAGALIPMSSWRFWREVGRFRQLGRPVEDFASLLLVSGVAFGLLTLAGVALWRFAPARRERVPAGLLGLLGLMVGLALWTMLAPNDLTAGVVPALLANIAMIGLAIHLVNVGAREERVRPFGAGVLYFLTWAIARYLDLFNGAGGMLGGAAIFALCGVALVVVARFWTRLKRREPAAPVAPAAAWPGPAWASEALTWVRGRTRPVLFVAAGFQLLFLVGMIAAESAPLLFGQTISLRVRPVDPRDFFRGDYVILNYDISRMDPKGDGGWGRPVYVAVEPDADGRHWRGISASYERPAAGTYLIGRQKHHLGGGLSFGIEAFYVQEGEGRTWEDAARKGTLSAEVVLSPWGKAKLKRLVIDE